MSEGNDVKIVQKKSKPTTAYMSSLQLAARETTPRNFSEIEKVMRQQRLDFTLEKVVDMSETRAALSQFCQKNNCGEVFEFYDMVDQYRNKRCEQVMKQMAKELYEKYIRIGSAKEINISDAMRNRILKEIEKEENWEEWNSRENMCKLFDEAQLHVFHLMKLDVFPRFVRSKYFCEVLEENSKELLYLKISKSRSSFNLLDKVDDLIPEDLGKHGASITEKDFQFFLKLIEDSIFHWDILAQTKENIIFVSKQNYHLKDHAHNKECVPCKLYKYTGVVNVSLDAVKAIAADGMNMAKSSPILDVFESIGLIDVNRETKQHAAVIFRETTKPLPFVKPREMIYSHTMRMYGNRFMNILKSIQTDETSMTKKHKRGCMYSCLSAEALSETSVRYTHIIYIDFRISTRNTTKSSLFRKYFDEKFGVMKGMVLHKVMKEVGTKMFKKFQENPQQLEDLKTASKLYQTYITNTELFNS